MKKLSCLALVLFTLSACAVTAEYPADAVSGQHSVIKGGVQNNLSPKEEPYRDPVEAMEKEDDSICVGALCSCASE